MPEYTVSCRISGQCCKLTSPGQKRKKNILNATTSLTSKLISQFFSLLLGRISKCPVSRRCKYSHLGTFRHWLGLRGNRASTFHSVGRWWGYGTAHTRCCSHMYCDHYTGMLEDKSWLFRKNSFGICSTFCSTDVSDDSQCVI